MDAKPHIELTEFLPSGNLAKGTGRSLTDSRASSPPESNPIRRSANTSRWWADRSDNQHSCVDPSVNQALVVESVLERLNNGNLWVVNGRRRNGIILYRGFYAEFAGPGAAVGGPFDQGCEKIIPLGNLSLIQPTSHEDQQKALKIRLQWIRLTQNFTDQPRSTDRAQMILEQFKTYFDQSTVDQVPNEAFALMVGVLPQTIQRVRAGIAR